MGRDVAAFGPGELRLGRRLLVSFVLSAVLPISLAFAYVHVSDQLRDQSERRLRLASRAVGLELLDRLQSVDRALGRYALRGTLPPPEVPIAAIGTLDPSGAGVAQLQGFRFARPGPAEAVEAGAPTGKAGKVGA